MNIKFFDQQKITNQQLSNTPEEVLESKRENTMKPLYPAYPNNFFINSIDQVITTSYTASDVLRSTEALRPRISRY